MNTDSKKNETKQCTIPVVRRSFLCQIGLHDWYKGSFSSPVWWRYERHCLECDKKQYSQYKDKKKYWVDF